MTFILIHFCNIFAFPGSCFIRTDQLDGETDWKLRVAVACTQRLSALGVRTSTTHFLQVYTLTLFSKKGLVFSVTNNNQ